MTKNNNRYEKNIVYRLLSTPHFRSNNRRKLLFKTRSVVDLFINVNL